MKKIFAVLMVAAALAGCTATEKGAAIGAASGAAIGGLATGRVGGAVVGAAIGGVAGGLIGRASEHPGRCYYRNSRGQRYLADCPRGY